MPITHEQYGAIWRTLGQPGANILAVFETASYPDYWLTVWGVAGSDVPLLKSLRIGHEPDGLWSYAIAAVDLRAFLEANE